MSTMREALEAAFDQHSEEPSTEPQAAPDAPESEPTPSPDVAPASEPTEPPEVSGEPGEGRVRDSLGRFVPKAADSAPPVAPKGAQPGAPVAPNGATQQTPKFEPPPRSVPPALRSNWTALTPEWRQHITEAHTKLATVEEQYRPSVEFASNFMRAIEPYRAAIQIETGGNPLQAVVGLMDTATRLRFGTPGEKAGIITHLINTYGVDIETLDKSLVGMQPDPQQQVGPQYIQQQIQQALSPLMQAAQQRRARAEQQQDQQVSTEMQKFAADPKNEFFEDVRNIMADLIEVADKHGQDMTYADAYSRACLLHPEISKVILARQQGSSAQQLTQAAQRAKAAAVSVKGAAPVGSPNPTEPTSVRAAIEAAIEAHSRV